MDVNLILYLLWWAQRGRRLSKGEIRNVIDLIGPWQENVVYPLRLIRRFLKSPPSGWNSAEIAAFRQQVKADELQAEKLQQGVMEAAFASMGQPDDVATAASVNLNLLGEVLQVDFPADHLATLVARLPQAGE